MLFQGITGFVHTTVNDDQPHLSNRPYSAGRYREVKEVDNVIHALESITDDPDHSWKDSELSHLSQDCVAISRLEGFLPGAYNAASTLLEGIQAARLRSHSIAQQRMLAAVELLRGLPVHD